MIKNLSIENIRKNLLQEKKIINELTSLFTYFRNTGDPEEKRMISVQIENLKKPLQKTGQDIIASAEKLSLSKPLAPIQKMALPIKSVQKTPKGTYPRPRQIPKKKERKFKPDSLEKLTLKRIKKKEEKVIKKKEKKPSKYVKTASKFFYKTSMSLLKKGYFEKLSRDLIKSNINLIPANYVSMIFFSTAVSLIVAFLILLFFLFFSLSTAPPFITLVEENIGIRFLKVFWILLALPLATFIFAYLYPSLERKSLEDKINRELPFAAIHMSSISGSMIEPSKIFNIIIATKEYPNLEKEFIKVQNEINIYGYDLVTALRNRSFNSPSRKLADLFNGLATTITSGGNLPEFFEKRSQTLLFEHRLEMERQLKAAETFMDIYISVVIAAPMVLMLVLMMMRISGLGISLSPFMISFVMIMMVSLVNIFFLTFLHIKQPKG